jgi:hypothetical protein
MAYDKIKTESYALLGGMNSKASPYVQGPMEFRKLVNVNFSSPGALSGRPGTVLYLGATLSGRITGGYEFERLDGSSYLILTANTNAYTVTGSFNVFKTSLLDNALFDFVTFVDRLFACNGQDYFKFDGTNTAPYSLPAGLEGFGLTAIGGGSLISGGVTGTFVASYGYVNERGYFGPLAAGITITMFGASYNSIGYVGLSAPAGFGITGIALYRSSPGGVDLFGTTTTAASTVTVTDPGWPLTARVQPDSIYFTLIPKYLEIYNNQLFMAGFSAFPSTVHWSQIGEPEGVEPDFNAEFRTNDGDRITGMKPYNGSMVVTKERSFHRITGDNPENFLIQEISDQYGCVSNRAIIQFEDNLYFLDPKGIVEYNGANVKVVSNKVEEIFSRMNLAAARDNAAALHFRQNNEIWFGIPVGSTINNTLVVFDYLAQAWTTYEGLNVSNLFSAKGSLDQRVPFYGGYTGSVSYFGTTLTNDNGAEITYMILPPFMAPAGQTTESQWRRFYLNVDPVLGFTQAITINLRTNYGTTIQATRTMYQAPYQSRIDFGLSARSIQPEIISASASFPIKVNGYAFARRFQRDS